MSNITIGLDLAKRIFHIAVLKNTEKTKYVKLKREEVLDYFANFETKDEVVIGLEACCGCHFWARSLMEMGYQVRMLKPIDVKAYAKSKQKNDRNDALAIAKATLDTELKDVSVKSRTEQAIFLIHKLREGVIKNRIEASNRFIAILHEFGYVPTRNSKNKDYLKLYLNEAITGGYICETVFELLSDLLTRIEDLYKQEHEYDKKIAESNKNNPKAQRFLSVIGIGPINASILSAVSMENYETSRDFAASLGLVPKQNSTGGNVVLGSITKQGDRYVRKMLIQGARSLMMRMMIMIKSGKNITDKLMLFAQKLLKSKSFNKVAIAVANKMARLLWAMNKNQ